jgi:hypothetical protein
MVVRYGMRCICTCTFVLYIVIELHIQTSCMSLQHARNFQYVRVLADPSQTGLVIILLLHRRALHNDNEQQSG